MYIAAGSQLTKSNFADFPIMVNFAPAPIPFRLIEFIAASTIADVYSNKKNAKLKDVENVFGENIFSTPCL